MTERRTLGCLGCIQDGLKTKKFDFSEEVELLG